MPPPAAAGLFKFKRMVWATAFAAVTIVGTMYGASLKTERQADSVRPHARRATPFFPVA